MRGDQIYIGLFAWAIALAVSPSVSKAQEAIAAHTLRAGVILTEDDLREVPGAHDAGDRLSALVGLETRRAIYAGRPIAAPDLGPPTLVRRNAVVVMHYRDNALGIRTEGRALDSGGDGEQVRIINLTSRHTVKAIVTGIDQVEVRR